GAAAVAKSDSVSLKKDGPSPKESASEVFTLVRDYAKQETVDPLKGLLGFVKWGLIGALLVGIGLIELMLAVLRVSQSEGSGVFDGRLSFVPYVITLAVATLVLYWAKRGMSSKKSPTAGASR
ncbi:MAG TPA: hypothetical protein VK507_23835, partial [Iamia sp.]|nr:hypothetical protein [Iamia sp.]